MFLRDRDWAQVVKTNHFPHTLHGSSGVVRDEGRCAFGDEVFTATYDPRLGIFAESPAQLTPIRMDDDEFDY
jgi:hypothetical protein